MPESGFAQPTLLPPASSQAPADTDSPDLLSARNELAEARQQLAQVQAQLLEFQEQNAQIRARQAQILETLNNDQGPRDIQVDAGLGIQVAPTEPQSTSTTPQETPSTDVSALDQPQTSTETSPNVPIQADGRAPEIDVSHLAAEDSAEEPQQAEELVPATDAPGDLPPPSSPPVDAAAEPPEWVDIEEDTSTPDQEELKEIEASNDISARDVKYHEESFYADAPDDPEQQPLQKMLLTWVIKGVRGTREKPNRARIMNSPPVLVGGFYWYLKFFPRGNNSSALSAYVKCSRKEPKPDDEVPENTFSVVYGAPDADLGELKPAIDVSIPATPFPLEQKTKTKGDESSADDTPKKTPDGEIVQHGDSANASADTEESAAAVEDEEEDAEDWRVSAQIGIIIYNPEEPRTKFDMAACHQFNKHNDDWGWTNFHGPWSEIHKRRHGQRQALLRNDTIALDAYIRIFNDPSQALWWHSCGAEEQWNSMSLTGYPAMGTKYYHSPAVAGITSWLLLAPFRKIFQSLETDGYRKDSHMRPQSLCSQLQMVLYLMRKQKEDERFVSLEAIVDILDKLDESGTDVFTFWEGFRRSLELELGPNRSAIEQIADIFDGRPAPGVDPIRTPPLRIPVEDIPSIQSGIERALAEVPAPQHFPKFLTIELERQKFDTAVREWKLLYDRVRLSEELDLSRWSAEPETSGYTLYGFDVHADERTSGKFYSILRPNGPGSKWLAFEDGNSNQVISYTKHRIQEFEGLEGDALKENKGTRQTAYLAMYIRTDLLKEFLPGALEPYELSPWLRNCPQVRDYVSSKDVLPYKEETRSEVKLEIYASKRAKDRRGLIDVQDLKDIQASSSANPPQHLTVPAETTYQELRQKLAKWNDIENVEKIKLWTMQPPSPGAPLNESFRRVSRLRKTVWDRNCATRYLCIWMHILSTDEDVKTFGDPELAPDHGIFDRPVKEGHSLELPVHEIPESAAEAAAPQETTSNEEAEGVESTDPNDAPPHNTIPAVVATENAELSTNSATQIPVAVEVQALTPSNTEDPTSVGHTQEASTSVLMVSDEDTAAAASAPVPVSAEEPAEDHNEPQTQSSSAPPPIPADDVPSQATAEVPSTATVSADDEMLIAALIAQDLEQSDAFADAIADEIAEESTEADAVAPNVSTNSPDTLVETAVHAAGEPTNAPATDLPLAEQPGVENREAVEAAPPPPAAETTNEDAQSDSSDEDEIATIRPIPFYYGFIQIFDAQAQEFVMHGDFLAAAKDDVKEFVRKHLGYASDKSFNVWRRGDAYRLTSVPASSTFGDVMDCTDGFVLVVGEVLSDSA